MYRYNYGHAVWHAGWRVCLVSWRAHWDPTPDFRHNVCSDACLTGWLTNIWQLYWHIHDLWTGRWHYASTHVLKCDIYVACCQTRNDAQKVDASDTCGTWLVDTSPGMFPDARNDTLESLEHSAAYPALNLSFLVRTAEVRNCSVQGTLGKLPRKPRTQKSKVQKLNSDMYKYKSSIYIFIYSSIYINMHIHTIMTFIDTRIYIEPWHMYIYIYIYTHAYIYIHIHTYIYMYIYIYK